MPLIAKADLEDLLAKFRQDTQENNIGMCQPSLKTAWNSEEELHKTDAKQRRTRLIQEHIQSLNIKPDRQPIRDPDVI